MNKFTSLVAASAVALTVSAPATAEQLYGFSNISVSYVDWSSDVEEKSQNEFSAGKKDFGYIELEGGAGFHWGDVYGFFDIENPESLGNNDKDADGRGYRIAAKGRVNLNLGETNWNLMGQAYHAESTGFFATNIVTGISYDLFTSYGLWAKPFIGTHFENNVLESGNGFNGYMAGWVVGYDFKVAGQKFSVTNWHETEFGRKDRFGVESVGHNGAVALWAHLPANLTAGLQYRYFEQKLGEPYYGDALIYTLKYNF